MGNIFVSLKLIAELTAVLMFDLFVAFSDRGWGTGCGISKLTASVNCRSTKKLTRQMYNGFWKVLNNG